MLKTVKFGGSSLADGDGFRRAGEIIHADDARKIVVVSAPGRRQGGDSKVTDLLYLCCAYIRHGVHYALMLTQVEERFQAIADQLSIDYDVAAAFEEIRANLAQGAGEAYLVSRGEALCGRLMATYLGFEYLDARDCIRMHYDGTVDLPSSYARLAEAYGQTKGRVVIPGFFGQNPTGKIQLMSRGGSDITGAIAATALRCDLYENWTDVPGILMADPNIVPQPRPIAAISYDELQELTRAGAQVFHEASVFPVRQAGIPINIRDTGNPGAPGTLIGCSADSIALCQQEDNITGVTGRKGYSILDIRGSDTPVFERLSEILTLLTKRKISVEQVLSGNDSFSLIIPAESGEGLYTVLGEMESLYGVGTAQLTEGIALIACVCRKSAAYPGVAGRLLAALGNCGVGIRVVSQRPLTQTTIVGVSDEDFERAVNIIYNSFAPPCQRHENPIFDIEQGTL